MSELDIAKEKFYIFFVGVAGLRFMSREQFGEVVDAIVVAAQHSVQRTACTREHPWLPIGGEGCELCGGWVEPTRR